MKSTIADIAKRTGASITTVSRVLNSKAAKYRISEQTEKLILAAAKDLKYRPNQIARSLRLRKTQSIGLVIPDISNPFFASVTRSIQTVAHKLGYSLVVCDTDENFDLEVDHINLLVAKGIDGLIVLPVGQRFDHLSLLTNEGIPFVLVDRCFEEIETNSVVVDNYHGAFEAVEHLIHAGHRRIAIIQGLHNTYTNKGRLRGYLDALRKHGIATDESLIVGNSFRKETGYHETKALITRPEKPTAIFATSDLITLGVLEALEEVQLRIPDDLSLVAFDEIEFSPFLRCPLTMVAQPKESMGEHAAQLLIDNIKTKGRKPLKHIMLAPSLIPGRSVRNLRLTSHHQAHVA
jgi:LacI family transcriptional regulator